MQKKKKPFNLKVTNRQFQKENKFSLLAPALKIKAVKMAKDPLQ